MKIETLDLDSFLTGMKQFEDAFIYQMPERQAKIYFQKLANDFSGEEFEKTVDVLFETCRRFPTIADFYEKKKIKDPYVTDEHAAIIRTKLKDAEL